MNSPTSGHLLSRRQVIQPRIFAGAVVLGGAAFLDGCAPTPSTSATSTTPTRGGMLVHGIQGGSSSDSLDPHRVLSAADYARFTGLYETLWTASASYTIDEWLIESAEPQRRVDRVDVRLKQGIEFPNGKTVTAEDMIFSVERLLDLPPARCTAGCSPHSNLANTRKLDDRTVRFVLTSGLVTFPRRCLWPHRSSQSIRHRQPGRHRAVQTAELPAGSSVGHGAKRELLARPTAPTPTRSRTSTSPTRPPASTRSRAVRSTSPISCPSPSCVCSRRTPTFASTAPRRRASFRSTCALTRPPTATFAFARR